MSRRPPRECRVSRSQTEKLDTRDVSVAALAAAEWGVLSLAELRDCGLDDDAVSVRVRNGRLHPMYRAVYAVGHRKVSLEGQLLAAVKACGEKAVLSHRSAAALWGFVPWDCRWYEVTVPGSGTRVHEGLRVHRSRVLPREHVWQHKGIAITSPAWTLMDLAASMSYKPYRRAAREAQSLRRVNVRQLLEVLDLCRGRRGARNLARVIATGPAPTRSELEDVVLDLFLGGGLLHPDVNKPLRIGGRRVVPDFRWADQRLVVEADGAAWHENQLAREDDAERQALLEAAGERVIRVTWDQSIVRPTQTLARVRAAGAPTS